MTKFNMINFAYMNFPMRGKVSEELNIDGPPPQY